MPSLRLSEDKRGSHSDSDWSKSGTEWESSDDDKLTDEGYDL